MNSTTAKQSLAIGVTGGIGSGKSEVCRIFSSFGASVLYADVIAKELLDSNKTVRQRVQRSFGDELYSPDGTLNRKQMARIIFTDDSAKEKINNIVHPLVLECLQTKIEQFKKNGDGSLLLVEAALLYEANADAMFDYMIVVDADKELKIDRVTKRDQSTRTEVLRRMNAQMSVKEKNELGDFIIKNSGDKAALESNCRFLFNLLTTMTKVK